VATKHIPEYEESLRNLSCELLKHGIEPVDTFTDPKVLDYLSTSSFILPFDPKSRLMSASEKQFAKMVKKYSQSSEVEFFFGQHPKDDERYIFVGWIDDPAFSEKLSRYEEEMRSYAEQMIAYETEMATHEESIREIRETGDFRQYARRKGGRSCPECGGWGIAPNSFFSGTEAWACPNCNGIGWFDSDSSDPIPLKPPQPTAPTKPNRKIRVYAHCE